MNILHIILGSVLMLLLFFMLSAEVSGSCTDQIDLLNETTYETESSYINTHHHALQGCLNHSPTECLALDYNKCLSAANLKVKAGKYCYSESMKSSVVCPKSCYVLSNDKEDFCGENPLNTGIIDKELLPFPVVKVAKFTVNGRFKVGKKFGPMYTDGKEWRN